MGLWFAAEDEFDETVEGEAHPGIDEQAPVEVVRFVTRGRWEVRHEDEEIEQAAEDDGGGLLEEAGAHS